MHLVRYSEYKEKRLSLTLRTGQSREEGRPIGIDWVTGALIEICAGPVGMQRQERLEKEERR